MDDALLERFKQTRMSPRRNASGRPPPAHSSMPQPYSYSDAQYVENMRTMYANRVYEGGRMENVFFVDGPVTEQNMIMIRMMLHEFIRLKALSDSFTKPNSSTQAVQPVATPGDVFQPRDPRFLVPPYIVLSIRSPGGDMIAAMALCSLIRTVQSLGVPVIGVVNGIAYSAGFMILTACQYRYMLPHSHIMSHEYKTGIEGTASGLKHKQQMLDDYNELTLESLLGIEADLRASEEFQKYIAPQEGSEESAYDLHLKEQKIRGAQEGELHEDIVAYIKDRIEVPGVDNFLRFDRATELGIVHGVITDQVYARYLYYTYSVDRARELNASELKRVIKSPTRAASAKMQQYAELIAKHAPDKFFDVSQLVTPDMALPVFRGPMPPPPPLPGSQPSMMAARDEKVSEGGVDGEWTEWN